jgi:hypothetical protein
MMLTIIQSPVQRINIRTTNIPHPTTLGSSKIWEQYISAEETLTAATLLLVALVKGSDSKSDIPAFNRNIRQLDNVITHQLATLSDAVPASQDASHSAEERLAIALRITTQIRLHRYRPSLFTIPFPRSTNVRQ